jgi:hypothetical protein
VGSVGVSPSHRQGVAGLCQVLVINLSIV